MYADLARRLCSLTAGRVAPIVGATKPHHLNHTVDALDVKLTADEMKFLEELYEPHPVLGFSGSPKIFSDHRSMRCKGSGQRITKESVKIRVRGFPRRALPNVSNLICRAMEDTSMILLSKSGFSPFATLTVAAVLGLTAVAVTQETSTTTTTPKSVAGVVTIDTAQVVYVSGDDVVLKQPDGGLRLLDMRPGTPLVVDGKQVKPSDLTPGSNLAHVQVHRRMESDVTTVTQINGTITAKKGRVVTVRLDDGTSKIYSVPYDATFNIDGKTVEYADVSRGSKISATVVKTEGLSTISNQAAMVGETPPQSGTLLIEK